ncbi:hypothetical protein VNN32_02745 [Lactococcus petauri]|uniref:hypothetical protein n=1 Tax=Lactococcus petauri TaxID=1940789 RepID=UPI0030D62BDE
MNMKKCCSGANCEHEFNASFDLSTGWVICTNSTAYAQILKVFKNESAVLSYSNLTDNHYATLKTKDVLLVRNIISELES